MYHGTCSLEHRTCSMAMAAYSHGTCSVLHTTCSMAFEFGRLSVEQVLWP